MTAAYQMLESTAAANPLDLIEDLALGHGWSLARPHEEEAQMIVATPATELQVSLSWNPDNELLQLAAMYDFRVPQARRAEAMRLIGLLNERLAAGHFEIWSREGLVLYRNALLLAGGAPATPAQCEALIATAVQACAAHYPAFQFVLWAGRRAEEALRDCIFETAGEA